jgi:hypothetical protein
MGRLQLGVPAPYLPCQIALGADEVAQTHRCGVQARECYGRVYQRLTNTSGPFRTQRLQIGGIAVGRSSDESHDVERGRR